MLGVFLRAFWGDGARRGTVENIGWFLIAIWTFVFIGRDLLGWLESTEGGVDLSDEALLFGVACVLVARTVRYLLPKPPHPNNERLRRLGESGDVYAQYELAKTYETEVMGFTEAVRWYQKAAATGSTPAALKLGFMEFRSPIDFKEAANWFRKAADNGSYEAALLLGGLYAKGFGTTRNMPAAVNAFHLALEKYVEGHESDHPFVEMGKCHLKRRSRNWPNNVSLDYDPPMSQEFYYEPWNEDEFWKDLLGDYAIAHMWFSLGMAQGHKSAQSKLKRLASRMKEDELEEARLLVHEWKKQEFIRGRP